MIQSLPGHNQTINLRIEVLGGVIFPKVANPISNPVAGVRRMGCTSEHHVSWAKGSIKLLLDQSRELQGAAEGDHPSKISKGNR